MVISPNKIICDSSLLSAYQEKTSDFLSKGVIEDYYNIALPLLIESINNTSLDTSFLELYYLTMLISRNCYIGEIKEKANKILLDTLKSINIAPEDSEIGISYCDALVKLNLLGIAEDNIFDKIKYLLQIVSLPLEEVYLKQYFFQFIYLVNNIENNNTLSKIIFENYTLIKNILLNLKEWQKSIIKEDIFLLEKGNFYCFCIIFYLYYLKVEERAFSYEDEMFNILLILPLMEKDYIKALSSIKKEELKDKENLLFTYKNFFSSRIPNKKIENFYLLMEIYFLKNKNENIFKEKEDVEKIKSFLEEIKNKKIDFVYLKPLHNFLFSYFLEYPTKENINLAIYILKENE